VPLGARVALTLPEIGKIDAEVASVEGEV